LNLLLSPPRPSCFSGDLFPLSAGQCCSTRLPALGGAKLPERCRGAVLDDGLSGGRAERSGGEFAANQLFYGMQRAYNLILVSVSSCAHARKYDNARRAMLEPK
jgi:hypothetical protein